MHEICEYSHDKNAQLSSRTIAVFILALFAFSRQSWGLFLPSEIWAVLILVSVFLLLLMNLYSSKWVIKGNIKKILLIIMFMIMTFYKNHDLSSNEELIRYMIIYHSLVIFYCCCGFSPDNNWIRPTLNMIVIFSLFYSIVTIMCYVNQNFYYGTIKNLFINYGMNSGNVRPAAGFTTTSSNNGLYTCTGAMIIGSLAFFGESHKSKFLNLAGFVFLLGAFLMTGKRGMLLGLFIAFFISYSIYTTKNKHGRVFKMVFVVLVLLTILYIISLLMPSVFYVFRKNAILNDSGDITNGRLLLWETALKYFKDNPIFGYGWRWFKYNNGVIYRMDVHNVYLQLLVETGVIGSIPFYMFIIISYIRAINFAKSARMGTSLPSDITQGIFVGLTIETFMVFYFFESTAFYMSECLFIYLLSCSILEIYGLQMNDYRSHDNKAVC